MKPEEPIEKLWRWLEGKLRELNLKLDHILFRLREEDPRTYRNEKECMSNWEDEEQQFKDN